MDDPYFVPPVNDYYEEFVLTLPPTTFATTESPTNIPSLSPTTMEPTANPTTWSPTMVGETRPPTLSPTQKPTKFPSVSPTKHPTEAPTVPVRVRRRSVVYSNAEVILAAPAIPVQGTFGLVVLLMFIGVLYFLIFKKESSQKNRIVLYIKIPVILTFLSNFGGIICGIAVTIIMATTVVWDHERRNMTLYPFYTAAVLYSFGKLNMETFFILRVYNAFKGSAFELSKCSLVTLFVWMFLNCTLWCLMFVIDVTNFLGFDLPFYSFAIVSGCEGLLVLVLLFVFTKRLRKLLLMQNNELSIERSPLNQLYQQQQTL